MRGRGWGRVINIASATVAIPSPVSIAYRTAKMGTIGFTRALSATSATRESPSTPSSRH